MKTQIKPQIENSISRIAEQARGRYNKALTAARTRTEKAANRVSQSKKPVNTLSKLSLKLTAVSHRTADKVLKQQKKLLENQIDAFAVRLTAVAEATDVRSLVKTQIRLIPKNAALFANDARTTLSIVAKAGAEVRDLLKGTVSELRGVKKATVKKPVAKKATPARKKAVTKKAA